jgi:hypothetical protein
MTRLLFVAAMVLSTYSLAEPHGVPKQPTAGTPANGGRDRTERPLFEPYPATVNCDDREKALMAVQEMRVRRNEQLIANSHLPSVEAMKRILTSNVHATRSGAVRPETKEKEDNTYLQAFGLDAKPAPEPAAVIKTAVTLLGSDSYQEREIATGFLTDLGPALLREPAFNKAEVTLPEQIDRIRRIRAVVIRATAPKLFNESDVAGRIAQRLLTQTEWEQILQLAKENNFAAPEKRLAFIQTEIQKVISNKLPKASPFGATWGGLRGESFNESRYVLDQFMTETLLSFLTPENVIRCTRKNDRENGGAALNIRVLPSGEVVFSYGNVISSPGVKDLQVHAYSPKTDSSHSPARNAVPPSVRSLKTRLSKLVGGQLEAKGSSAPTASDLAWLAAWDSLRTQTGLDKDSTDGDAAKLVLPLLKSLDSEDFRIRFLASSLLEEYGPALRKNTDWIEATKYPGELTPTKRTAIQQITESIGEGTKK